MSRKPKVSIGLPVYNGENYLSDAIECLLAQTYSDFELIISDNASTDGTQQICESYARRDSRIRYFRETTNQGVVRNFNRAFELARGEYFKWAAHDDLHAPTFLQRCVDVLDREPSIILCSTFANAIDDAGRTIIDEDGSRNRTQDPMGVQLLDDNSRDRKLDSPQAHIRFESVLLRSTRCYEQFGLIRARVIRMTPRQGNYRGSEKVLLSELSLIGPFKVLPEKLLFVRWHDARTSAKTSESWRKQLLSPGANRKRFSELPRPARCAVGYWQAVWRQPLSPYERARCCLVLLKFLFQVSKWRPILREILTGETDVLAPPKNSSRGERPALQVPAWQVDPTAPAREPEETPTAVQR